jgi:histidinol-phosphate aminotransferase
MLKEVGQMQTDFESLAVEGVQALSPYQPGKPIDELAREFGLAPDSIVKLASNENPLGPSPKALSAIEKTLADLCRYPDGNGYNLKQALAKRYGIQPEQITLGNGSNDVLEVITRCFAAPGDQVVYSQYAFAVYPLVTQAIGATGVSVPAKAYGHDLDAMADAITGRTKLVFVANPNNPTGTVHGAEAIQAFLDRIPSRVLVVLDEAYCEYLQGDEYVDGLSLLERYPNLVVTRTFSKAWGLAALRVGYSVSSPKISNLLNRVRQPFNVDSIAMAAATAVLGDDDYLRRSCDINARGMKQLKSAFEDMGLAYIPSAGNFISVEIGERAAQVNQSLLEQGVIVRPIGGYGLPRHLRVSIGLPEENDRFIAALAKALESLSPEISNGAGG